MTAETHVLTPGDVMRDGTVYAGISPDTHLPMFTTNVDAPLAMTFKEAVRYVRRQNASTGRIWRIPTRGELRVMFENQAAIGGFQASSREAPYGTYMSSTLAGSKSSPLFWMRRFSDGYETAFEGMAPLLLRLVCG